MKKYSVVIFLVLMTFIIYSVGAQETGKVVNRCADQYEKEIKAAGEAAKISAEARKQLDESIIKWVPEYGSPFPADKLACQAMSVDYYGNARNTILNA